MHTSNMLRGALLAAGVLLAGGAVRAEPLKLKFSMFFDPTEATYATTLKPWIEKLNAENAGVVEVVPFMNGALGRGPGVQAQNLLDGVADMAFIIPSFSPGRFPEVETMALPGLFDGFRDAAVICNATLMSGAFRDLDAFHIVWAYGNTPYSIHMRGKASDLADLRGKKIRVASSRMAEAVKALGGVPVVIPVTEVAEALGRGTVDGALAPVPTMADYGIDRVTRSDFLLPVSTGCGFVGMAKVRWDTLPEPVKTALGKASSDWVQARYLNAYDKHEAAAQAKLQADGKRTVTVPNADQVAAARAAYAPLYLAFAATSPRNAELLKMLQDRIAQYRGQVQAEAPK